MNLHAVKTVGTVDIGHGALLLLIIDEVALEEDDRSAWHRSAHAVAHLAFDDAAVVEGDQDIPAGDHERSHERHQEKAMQEKASPAQPLDATAGRPRRNSFSAINR